MGERVLTLAGIDAIERGCEGVTPGPWRIDERTDRIVADSVSVGKPVALDVAKTFPRRGPAETKANARLIAAAPDLLAFAKRVMADHRAKLPSEARDLYGGGCGCPQCEQAAAAIQKAEGK